MKILEIQHPKRFPMHFRKVRGGWWELDKDITTCVVCGDKLLTARYYPLCARCMDDEDFLDQELFERLEEEVHNIIKSLKHIKKNKSKVYLSENLTTETILFTESRIRKENIKFNKEMKIKRACRRKRKR